MGKRNITALFFLRRLALFMLPLLLLFFFIEFRMRGIENGYAAKRDRLEKSLDSIELLILGNSHTEQGVDPAFFSLKAFNAAASSQSYFYDKEIVLRYLERLKSLKAVIIPVDYFSLSYNLHDVAQWLDYGYKNFWGIRSPDISSWDSRNYSYTMLYTPGGSVKYLFKGKKFSMAKGLRNDGYTPVIEQSAVHPEKINDKTGKERAVFHRRMMKDDRFNECVEQLTGLTRELAARGVKVYLIESPVFETYSKFCDTAILNKNRIIASEIAKKYKGGFKSYFSDPRFILSDFSDNDHLNRSGAEKFSRILDDDFFKQETKSSVRL